MATSANRLLWELDKLENQLDVFQAQSNIPQPEDLQTTMKTESKSWRKLTLNSIRFGTRTFFVLFLIVLLFIILMVFLHHFSTFRNDLEIKTEGLSQRFLKMEKMGMNNTKSLNQTLKGLMNETKSLEISQKESELNFENVSDHLRAFIGDESEGVRRDLQNFTMSLGKWIDKFTQNSRKLEANSTFSLDFLLKSFNSLAEGLKNSSILKPKNCQEIQMHFWIQNLDISKRNVYTIYPFGPEGHPVKVRCDFMTSGGGWTILQTRSSGPKDEFFNNWAQYEDGFGNVSGNYWIGLRTIRALTLDTPQDLRIDLGDWDGNTRYALYKNFSIGPSHNFYPLSIGSYSGDAGDSLTWHKDRKFATKDSLDDDGWIGGNCAKEKHGAWWYYSCLYSNLNGYYWGRGASIANGDGVVWYHWKGWSYSLMTTQMKIRDSSFLQNL